MISFSNLSESNRTFLYGIALNAGLGVAYSTLANLPVPVVTAAFVIKYSVEIALTNLGLAFAKNNTQRSLTLVSVELLGIAANYKLYENGIFGKKMALFLTFSNVMASCYYLLGLQEKQKAPIS